MYYVMYLYMNYVTYYAPLGTWKLRAAEVGAGQGWNGERGWMGIWRIWGQGQRWQWIERSGGVASWEERLTRISAEITGVKRAAVAYVLCYVLCYVIYRLRILIPMLIAVNLWRLTSASMRALAPSSLSLRVSTSVNSCSRSITAIDTSTHTHTHTHTHIHTHTTTQ